MGAVRIGVCQIDPTVGDFAGNAERIEQAVRRARQEGAQIAVLPELAVCGYPPEDLLLRESFLAAHDRTLQQLAENLSPDLCVLVGCLARNERAEEGGRPLYNAVALLEDGLARIVARKSLLPTYDIFDEGRYFEPWTHPEQNLITVGGEPVGVVVCEDGWNDEVFWTSRRYQLDPVQSVVRAGAKVVVNLSASPWCLGKDRQRHAMLQAAASRHGVPIVYVNQVGGNVGTQFDGASLAVKPEGLAFAPISFRETVVVVDTEAPWTVQPVFEDAPAMHHAAITQGLAAYCRKFGFAKVVLGLSGGIDSALTAALAADALGPDNVTGIAMPSRWSSDHSVADAERLAENLGIRFLEVPIEELRLSAERTLQPVFAGTAAGLAEENLQSRLRGMLLMAHANKLGELLLTTGNKSEAAVGYCTLYGDTCGALAPIADLWKGEVYELARWINARAERQRIPQASIDKAPSAELRPGQLDTDSLPPYPELDPVLRLLIEQERPVAEVAAATGMAVEQVQRLYRLVQQSEFKRFQYPPTIRVSERCWDGRRMPVAHRFLDEREVSDPHQGRR